MTKKVTILGVEPLSKFDSESVTDTTIGIMKKRSLHDKYVVGGTSDGASNMFGKHSGVLTRL